ncbi:hypothetical protein KAR91_40155, partial [Candidatus Pacearchaeota archaeon]|nr:hypothetical protein [Candidatus Pacearchaeota archaeon]
IDRHTGSCQLPQEAGEPCSKKSDCAQDLTCTNKKSSKKFFGIEGTCEAPREEGERCFKNNECEGGLICSDHECKAKQETGSLCETEHSENYDNYSPHADCADGYLCNDKITDEYGRSTCQPVETPGSKCYEGPWGTKLDCPEGQTCHSDSYNNFWGSCAPISEEDESCEADDDCFGDLKCRTETGSRTKSCQQPIQQGKPCNQETNFSGCDDGLVCMNKSSTCEPPSKEAGSACADNNECGQGLSCQEWENQCQPKQGEGGLCYDHADCKQGLACGDTADNSPVSTCFDPNNVEELNCHNYDDESLMALKQEIIEVDVQSIIEEAGKHKAYFLQNLFGVVPIIKYRIYSIENPEHIRNELCVGLNNLNMDLNYSDQLPIIIETEMLKVKNNPELMGIINENADQIHSLIQILRSLGNVNSESEISPWLITLAELFEELLD